MTHRIPHVPCPRSASHRRRGGGFTLVELMVATTLGLFLLIGLISLIVSNVQTRSELDKSSRQIESGRYALDLLSNDFQLAGFIGAPGGRSFTSVVPVPCPASIADLGYSAPGSGVLNVPLPVYALTTVPGCIDHVMTGTAVVVVTRLNTNAVAPASASATETYLQVSSCATDTGFFVAATGVSPSNFNLMQKDCVSSTPAPLRKIMQRIYFVSTCNVCGTDTVPTLKMAEYVNGAMTVTPLVEGIENLQLDYGVDMDGNGSPDCYTSNPGAPPATEIAPAVCPQTSPAYDWTNSNANWTNVMTVRLHVLARNSEPSGGWVDKRSYDMGLAKPTVGPFNDAIKRHAYSAVARLYNASGQRELP